MGVLFAVLDTEAQTEAVNIGLAAGALVVVGVLHLAALRWRNRRRQDRARAATEANRERASLRAAARGKVPAITDDQLARIVAELDGEAR